MKVKYDRANDFFWVDGKQLYWSSIYILRQKTTTFTSLCKKLKVSKTEQHMFEEELDDLRKLKFIRGKKKISTTKLGKEFLHDVEKRVKFKSLREKAEEDIDEVFDEARKVYNLDLRKTKLLIKKKPFHKERVDWFSLFVNSMVGFMIFVLTFLTLSYAVGTISLDAFVIQTILSPVASVMAIGSLTLFIGLLYYAGLAVDDQFFRRK